MGNDMSAISRLTAEEVQAEEDATVARINAGTREGQDAENKQFATAMRARTELKAAEKRAVELAKVNDVEEGEVDEDPSNPLDAWQPRKDKVSPIKVPTKPTPGPTPIATSSGIKQLVNREKPKAASDGPDSTSSAHKQPLITTTKPGLATTRLPAVKLPAVNTQSKRPAPSAFADERRPVAKSSKRTENASPRSPGEPVENKTRKSKPSRETPVLAEISERPPAWYQALQVVQRRGNADEASASPLIESLKDYVRKLADAEELYNKWCLQDFETDLLRGIVRGAPASKNVERRVDSIDEKYKGRASWIFHGNGLLLNGQWWPTQLTTVRDGAHGAMIAGISGAAGEGAYSCVMSSGHGYEDEDHGEWVLYCGTDSTDGKITDATLRMLESKENGKPVRIIRSHNLHSPFAPEIGFSKVVSSKALDKSDSTRRRHQFRLERVLGQAPIRSQEPEKRPTAQEIKAHKDDKEKRNLA
ncbi:hypothetical protein LTR49_024277 [Elasticomyces elasticus]|nr:hypothetical protein LTR49_024277 [Elasticomyces elasticus]